MRAFHAKILLFGEYTVLSGSSSMTVPFRKYSGSLTIPRGELSNAQFMSNAVLRKFKAHLAGIFTVREVAFDFKAFSADLDANLIFDSDIPQNYGVGSSGALVAAVFSHYALRLKDADLPGLRKLFAEAESYFHGVSSGSDPLSSYCDIPLLTRDQGVSELDPDVIKNCLNRFRLLDTGMPAATNELVSTFIEKIKTYPPELFRKYQDAVESSINAVRDNSLQRLNIDMQNVSSFQLDFFRDHIPEKIRWQWQEGLRSGQYYMKLCGSGGGGYFLIYVPPGKEFLADSIPVWE